MDQSGGSTPDVLTKYGIPKSEYEGNDAKMAELVHEFRTRIITSKALKTGQVIGAILFERTMDSQVRGKPTADYLWDERSIVPFVKIDKGLEEINNGVRMLKPMPDLDKLLKRAFDANVFGTKMRSIIFTNSPTGINPLLDSNSMSPRKFWGTVLYRLSSLKWTSMQRTSANAKHASKV